MKTKVEDINRNIYDIKNEDNYDFKMEKGINEEIVKEISKQKNEPEWMLEIRLKALETYKKLQLPTWGPDLSELNMQEIATYVKPKSKLNSSWDEVPEDIKNTFDQLGIPEAEKKSLAGIGAQYDSEVVYHSIKEELIKQGVIYTDMETAVREYPEIVKEHFMKCVPINDHKFVALHAAVWSGGSFVYVPENVKLDIPLQSYFRLNSPESGQFEHTLIIVEKGAKLHFIEGCSAPKYNKVNLHAGCVELYVKDDAYLRYSTIENWSKNMMNLNTKKALVGKNAQVDWVTGSFGSKVSMLYPMSILNGEGAKTEYTGITFAGGGQNLDTGFKVIHNAKNTSSVINSKSISFEYRTAGSFSFAYSSGQAIYSTLSPREPLSTNLTFIPISPNTGFILLYFSSLTLYNRIIGFKFITSSKNIFIKQKGYQKDTLLFFNPEATAENGLLKHENANAQPFVLHLRRSY